MRLELADLCDRAMQRLLNSDSTTSVAGAEGDAEAATKLDTFGSVAFEQIMRAMADGAVGGRDRLPSALSSAASRRIDGLRRRSYLSCLQYGCRYNGRRN